MKELRYQPLATRIKDVIDASLTPIENTGFYIYKCENYEQYGYPPRSDDVRALVAEGVRLVGGDPESNVLESGIDVLDIGEGRYIGIFDTAAASPLTPFSVPYDEFAQRWKRQKKGQGIDIPEDAVLIKGLEENATPSVVGLHLITWGVLIDTNFNHIMPIDIADLVGERKDFDDPEEAKRLSYFLLELQNKTHGSSNKLQAFYDILEKHMVSARDMIVELYNEVIVPRVQRRFDSAFLLDVLRPDEVYHTVITGFYRGDKLKQLDQSEGDGLGHGPQSSETFHIGNTPHKPPSFFINLAKKYYDGDLSMLVEDLQSSGCFTADIVNKQLLEKGIVNPAFIEEVKFEEQVFKQVDPLSAVAHDLLGKWLTHQIDSQFNEEADVIQEHKELSAEEDVDYKVSEGVEVLTETRLADCLYALNLVAKDFYELWRDGREALRYYYFGYLLDPDKHGSLSEKRYAKINSMVKNHSLPNELQYVLTHLRPTEKQIERWIALLHEQVRDEDDPNTKRALERVKRLRKYYKEVLQPLYEEETFSLESKIKRGEGRKKDLTELLTTRFKQQMFTSGHDKLNGYAVPGVPGLGMVFHTQDDMVHVIFSWLLSRKGGGELFGMGFERAEGRGKGKH